MQLKWSTLLAIVGKVVLHSCVDLYDFFLQYANIVNFLLVQRK